MSRFCKAELERAIEEIAMLLKRQGAGGSSALAIDIVKTQEASPKLSSPLSSPTGAIRSAGMPPDPSSFASSAPASSAAPGSAPADASIPSHGTVSFSFSELTESKFQRVWEAGVGDGRAAGGQWPAPQVPQPVDA